eukprot:1498368-Pyramimonas_sp.AAC.1
MRILHALPPEGRRPDGARRQPRVARGGGLQRRAPASAAAAQLEQPIECSELERSSARRDGGGPTRHAHPVLQEHARDQARDRQAQAAARGGGAREEAA